MDRKPYDLRERVVNSMNIPRDLALQDVLVSVTGNTRLCIENYKSILEYTAQGILVLTKHGRLRITGTSLEILSYSNEEMLIGGHIMEIVFLN